MTSSNKSIRWSERDLNSGSPDSFAMVQMGRKSQIFEIKLKLWERGSIKKKDNEFPDVQLF